MDELWSHFFCICLFHALSKKNRLYTDEHGTFLETEAYEFEHIQAKEGVRPKFSLCPGSML